MVEGSLAYVRKFYMSSQCTHTHPGTLSLFLCRTHTYGCTHKNRLLFLWKTGQQPHGQQTCVWRMCSLTHTISILCSVWLCVLECVLTVPCVLVCVCVWQCVWCACQCVGVCVLVVSPTAVAPRQTRPKPKRAAAFSTKTISNYVWKTTATTTTKTHTQPLPRTHPYTHILTVLR